MPISVCSTTEYNMNTCFQRTDEAELTKLLLKFLGPKLKPILPNQAFTPLKKNLTSY